MNLAELITAHKGDRSYVDLERDCGGAPKAARLQQLATQKLKNFPDPPTIQFLARGLRVTESAVVLAAGESLGLNVRRKSPALFDRFPAGTENLTEEQLRPIVDIARAFVTANQVATRMRSETEQYIREWDEMRAARLARIAGGDEVAVRREVRETSEVADRLAPAADEAVPGVDEKPGGSDTDES